MDRTLKVFQLEHISLRFSLSRINVTYRVKLFMMLIWYRWKDFFPSIISDPFNDIIRLF